MASLIDGYCSLKAKSSNLWSKVIRKDPEPPPSQIASDINRKSFDQYNLQIKSNISSPSKFISSNSVYRSTYDYILFFVSSK